MELTKLQKFLTVLLLLSTILYPQEMPVPVDIQYSLFQKILTYDRNLKSRGTEKLVVGIIYQEKFRMSLVAKDNFMAAFNASATKTIEGIAIECIAINIGDSKDITEKIADADVNILYVAPLRVPPLKEIADFCTEKQILTLSGVPEYIKSGLSVGIGQKGNKPEILINLKSAKAEGSNFSSNLLKLATVL